MRKLLLILLVLFLTAISYSQMAVVLGDNAYLRGSPAETGAVVDTLVPGAKVALIRQQGPWFLVQASPFVGWMHGNSLRLVRGAKPSSSSKVASVATSPSEPGTDARPAVSVDSKAKTPESVQASSADTPVTATESTVSAQRIYVRGPRGGCYYVRADGKKVYGDHRFCN